MRINSIGLRLSTLLGTLMVLCSAVGYAETTLTQTRTLDQLGENSMIRVLLIDSVTSMCVVPKLYSGGAAGSDWQVKTLSGKALATLRADEQSTIVLTAGEMKLVGSAEKVLGKEPVVLEPPAETAVITIKKVPFGVGWWWASAEDRNYIGKMEIRPSDSGKLLVVAVLPLESYMRGVVPSEIGVGSPLQAMCAQAVAARSAAVLALTTNIYSGPNYDICSDVACQAFSGVSKCTAESDEAVSSTRGLVLVFEGKPVSAYYASNCGGHTEDIRNVWPERAHDRAYWNGVCYDGIGTTTLDLSTEKGIRDWQTANPDCFCNPTRYKVPEWSKKYFRWTQECPADQVTSRVALKKDIGRVTEIRPLRRGVSGRLIEVEFVGEKGSLKVGPELAIRQIWDPALRSGAFVVDTEGPAGRPDKFILRGAGWGHGVGMCQTGAIGMANEGLGFREILKHFYPNATIEAIR